MINNSDNELLLFDYYEKQYIEKEKWETEFNIEEQKSDMMINELNKLPYTKRRQKIYQDRIKEKINKYFDFIDNFKDIEITNNYQPAINNYINGEYILPWLLPIIKDKKKFYLSEDKYITTPLDTLINSFINDFFDSNSKIQEKNKYKNNLNKICNYIKLHFIVTDNPINDLTLEILNDFIKKDENNKEFKLFWTNNKNKKEYSLFITSLLEKLYLLDSDYYNINLNVELDIINKLKQRLKTVSKKKQHNKIYYNNDKNNDKYFIRNQLGNAYYENILHNGHINYNHQNYNDDIKLTMPKNILPIRPYFTEDINNPNSIIVNNKNTTNIVRYCSFSNSFNELSRTIITKNKLEVTETNNKIKIRKASGNIYYYKDIVDKTSVFLDSKVKKCHGTNKDIDEFYLDPLYDAGQNITKGQGNNKIVLDWYPIKEPPSEELWIGGEKLQVMGYYINSFNKNILLNNNFKKELLTDKKYFIKEGIPNGFTIIDLINNSKSVENKELLFSNTIESDKINLLLNQPILFNNYKLSIKQIIKQKLEELNKNKEITSDELNKIFHKHILQKIIPHSNNLNNFIDFNKITNINDINRLLYKFNLNYNDLTFYNIQKYNIISILNESINESLSLQQLITNANRNQKILNRFFEQLKYNLLEKFISNKDNNQSNLDLIDLLNQEFKHKNQLLINKFIFYLRIPQFIISLLHSSLNNIYTVSKSIIIDILLKYSIIELLYPTKKDEIIKEYKIISEYNTLLIITNKSEFEIKLNNIENIIENKLKETNNKEFLYNEINNYFQYENFNKNINLTTILFEYNNDYNDCLFDWKKNRKTDLKKLIDRIFQIYRLKPFLLQHINYNNINISNINNITYNIKSIISQYKDQGYLFSKLEEFTYYCIQGKEYHNRILELATKKQKKMFKYKKNNEDSEDSDGGENKNKINTTDNFIIKILNKIKYSDLPILKKRIKFAAESLYNYILFDSYGCQGYNIVKVYKSIQDLKHHQGVKRCKRDINITKKYYELIIGFLIENRLLNDEDNINNEITINNDKEEKYLIKYLKYFNYTTLSNKEFISNLINCYKDDIKNINTNKDTFDIEIDESKCYVRDGDYCLIMDDKDNTGGDTDNVANNADESGYREPYNLYKREGNLWVEVENNKQSELGKNNIRIDLLLSYQNNITGMKESDFHALYNYFKRKQTSSKQFKIVFKNITYLFELLKQYNNINHILETSEYFSDLLNNLYNKIHKLLNIQETTIENKKNRPINIIKVDKQQDFHQKLLDKVFKKLVENFELGLIDIKNLINTYGTEIPNYNYIVWESTKTNMICKHWDYLATLYSNSNSELTNDMKLKLKEEYGLITNETHQEYTYCKVCGKAIYEESLEDNNQTEGFGKDSKPILLREVITDLVTIKTKTDFIKTKFHKRVDNFAVSFLKNINIKISDKHRKFIINHLEQCQNEVLSFEKSNIFNYFKNKKSTLEDNKLNNFLKKYNTFEKEYLDTVNGDNSIDRFQKFIISSNNKYKNLQFGGETSSNSDEDSDEDSDENSNDDSDGSSNNSDDSKSEESSDDSSDDEDEDEEESSKRGFFDSSSDDSSDDEDEEEEKVEIKCLYCTKKFKLEIARNRHMRKCPEKIKQKKKVKYQELDKKSFYNIKIQIIKEYKKEVNNLYLYNIIAAIFVILQTGTPDYKVNSIGSERETNTYFGITDFYNDTTILIELLKNLLLSLKKLKQPSESNFTYSLSYQNNAEIIKQINTYILGNDDKNPNEIIHNFDKDSISCIGIKNLEHVIKLYNEKKEYRKTIYKKKSEIKEWTTFRPFKNLHNKAFPLLISDKIDTLKDFNKLTYNNSISILILLNNYINTCERLFKHTNKTNHISPIKITQLSSEWGYLHFEKNKEYNLASINELRDNLISRIIEIKSAEQKIEKYSENTIYPLQQNQSMILKPSDYMNFYKKINEGLNDNQIKNNVIQKIKRIILNYDIYINYENNTILGTGKPKYFIQINDINKLLLTLEKEEDEEENIIGDNSEESIESIESNNSENINNKYNLQNIVNKLNIPVTQPNKDSCGIRSEIDYLDLLQQKSNNIDISNPSLKSELELYYDNIQLSEQFTQSTDYNNLFNKIINKVNNDNLIAYNGVKNNNQPIAIITSEINNEYQDKETNIINNLQTINTILKDSINIKSKKKSLESFCNELQNIIHNFEIKNNKKNNFNKLEHFYNNIKFNVLRKLFNYSSENYKNNKELHKKARYNTKNIKDAILWSISIKRAPKTYEDYIDFLDFDFNEENIKKEYLKDIYNELSIYGINLSKNKDIKLQKYPKNISKIKKLLKPIETNLIDNEIDGKKNKYENSFYNKINKNISKYIQQLIKVLYMVNNKFTFNLSIKEEWKWKYNKKIDEDNKNNKDSKNNEDSDDDLEEFNAASWKSGVIMQQINKTTENYEIYTKFINNSKYSKLFSSIRELLETDIFFKQFNNIFLSLQNIISIPNKDYNELTNNYLYKQKHHKLILQSIFYIILYKLINTCKKNKGLLFQLNEFIKTVIFKNINKEYKFDIKTLESISTTLEENKERHNKNRKQKYENKTQSQKQLHKLKRGYGLGKVLAEDESVSDTDLLKLAFEQQQSSENISTIQEEQQEENIFAFNNMINAYSEDNNDEISIYD